MIVDSAARHESSVPVAELPYVSISPAKVVLLVVATFGLYSFWWFYKQWRHVRRMTGARILPVMRALFAPLFCFALFRDVEADLAEHRMKLPMPAFILGLVFLASGLMGRLPDPYWLLALIGLVPLVLAQRSINHLHERLSPGMTVSTRLGFGSGVVLSLGAVGWLLVIFGLFTPELHVRTGSELKASELEFLQSRGYVLPGEEVIFFYSAGVWSIREEGNILTDRRVVAYENFGADEYHEAASFDEIFHIDAIYSDSWLDDSQVIVTTIYNREVRLVLSTEKGRDRDFVDRLTTEWRKRIPEGEEVLLVPEEPEVETRSFTLS